jgi:cell division protein FtsW
LLAAAFIRVMTSSNDSQVIVTTGTVMVWIIGQAMVNIGVVLGVFPVLGVPLPLISAGGTALLTTLLAIGVVLSFARQETEASESARLKLLPNRMRSQ